MADQITIRRAVVEQALEALTNCTSEYGHRCNRCDSEVDEGGRVVAALRSALAQAEPVACSNTFACRCHKHYTAPQQQQAEPGQKGGSNG